MAILERNNKLSTRSYGVVSTRDVGDGPKRLSGYAAKFDVESSTLFDSYVMDSEFVEIIRPGAFTRTLKENPDIRALYNHDTSSVLGRTGNGSLKLSEDDIGLKFDNVLPDTQDARDAWTLVKDQYITGCSFGFSIVENRITEDREAKKIIHELLDVELYEVSIAVTFPAYEDSTVSARSRRTAQRRTPRLDHARRVANLRALGIHLK